VRDWSVASLDVIFVNILLPEASYVLLNAMGLSMNILHSITFCFLIPLFIWIVWFFFEC
jgi:hypothetical protein